MKITATILGILIGGYMLFDGIFVLINGKFFGPDKPGPWAVIFYKMNIDVFKLGPLFILLSLTWFIFLFGLWTNQSWYYSLGIIISILSLWYLPFGTIISIIIILILFCYK